MRHVHHIVRPRLAHKAQNFEYLLKMQVLLISHDVKAFVEIVSLFAVYRRREIARRIQRRAVASDEKARGHLVALEPDDLCAVRKFEQSFFLKLVEYGLHFVVVKTLSRIRVERDVEALVYPVDLFHRHFFEVTEKRERFFVAVLYLLEPGARFVVERRVFFCLFVVFHVYIEKRLDSALVDVLAAAPLLISHDEFAELSAPVSEVVDAYDLITQRTEYPAQRAAYRRIEKVSHVEGLCDIHRRKVYADGLARSFLRPAVTHALGQDLFDDARSDHLFVEGKIDVAADRLRLFEEIVSAYA